MVARGRIVLVVGLSTIVIGSLFPARGDYTPPGYGAGWWPTV
jgi:hypothetical protein